MSCWNSYDMKTPRSRPHDQSPHLDHLFKISELSRRAADTRQPKTVRREAAGELERYKDEGRIIQSVAKEDRMEDQEADTFSGRGIIFAVIDDREAMDKSDATTVDVISDAIEAALDNGYETSEEIARYLVTSAFHHVEDKRVRFNSVLKAGDVVGAHITRKLYNAYNDVATMAQEAEDPKEKRDAKMEATGFAEAVQIVISPFSSEDPDDYRLVNWDMVDKMTELFEKEQRLVRKSRNGNPQ